MKFELKLNSISLNPVKTVRDMKPWLIKALGEAEKLLIEFMQEAIDETSTAPERWRDQLKKDLHHVSEEVADNYIRYYTGVDYAQGTGAWMRAMVIAYGMGKLGLNGNKIMAGPEGRIVWDGELENRVPSKVKDEHEIPETWQHAGGWFIHNAISEMKTLYAEIIEDAMTNMPAAVFSKNIKIKKK